MEKNINVIDNLHKECEDKKQENLDRLSKEQYQLLTEKNQLDKKCKDVLTKIKNIKLNLRQIKAALGLWILVPFIGGGIGTTFGSFNWEYKITTKTYNMKTNETIGDDIITYKNENYNYKIVVKKCMPWEKKVNSSSFTREVLEYEYYGRYQDKEMDINMALQSVTPKYYRKEKEKLTSDEITNEPEIIITESHLDTNDRRIDKSFAITFGIICFLLLAILVSKNQIQYILEESNIKKLKEELKNYKITKKTMKEQYVTLGDKVVKFQEEYHKYGTFYDGKFELELNPELLDVVKKYIKK